MTLEKVKEALEYYANDDHWKHIYSSGSALPSDRCKLWQPAQKALTELNAYIARLKSVKLVDEMVEAYLKKAKKTTKCKKCNGECTGEYSGFCTCVDGRVPATERNCMKAAINVIKDM